MENKGKWERFSVAVAAAVAFVAYKGYQFNGGDQEEHLPFVYRLLDPSLYPSDYIVPEQTVEFTVRFYYAHLLASLGKFFPLPGTVFILYLSTLVAITSALSGLARLYGNGIAPILAPWALLFFGGITVGGNEWTDVQLTCTAIAMAFCCQGILANERGHPLLSAGLCGIGSLFQVLIGLQLAVLLLARNFFSSSTEGRLKGMFAQGAVYLLSAAPMLVPIVLQQSEPMDPSLRTEFTRILFYIRNAHHYVPAAFPLKDYVLTTAWWAVVWYLPSGMKSDALKSLFRVMMLAVLSGIFVYVVGFGIFDSVALGKTQWFKSTVWPGIVGGVVISVWLADRFKSFSPPYWLTKVSLSFTILVLLFITQFIPIPFERMARRYEVGRYLPQPLEKMHVWINDSTPSEAVVLAPPDDPSFLCEARRSMPVGYKAIIHTPAFMLNWYRLFCNVYDVEADSSLTGNILQQAVQRYRALPDSLVKSPVTIQYRLMDTTGVDPALWSGKKILHAEPPYLLMGFGE